MSVIQSPLKPAYSGVGAPASAFSSPAASVAASGQNVGAPSSSGFSPTAPISAHSLHNGAPGSTFSPTAVSSSPQNVIGGTTYSAYAPGNGAPSSARPADSISPGSDSPLYSPPAYSQTHPSPSPQMKPSSYQQSEHGYPEHDHQSQPHQSTFPPPKDDRQSYTQPPQMTYQQQPTIPEKPVPQVTTNEMQPHSHVPAPGPRSTWTYSVFDCFSPLSTCCLATWCPCFLYGRTYARENGQGETCGAGLMCCAWYCSTQLGLYGFLQCITRGSQRQRHGIESNACSDFLLSCCCSCCTMIQEEKESLVRVAGVDPVTGVKYQPVGQGMYYPA